MTHKTEFYLIEARKFMFGGAEGSGGYGSQKMRVNFDFRLILVSDAFPHNHMNPYGSGGAVGMAAMGNSAMDSAFRYHPFAGPLSRMAPSMTSSRSAYFPYPDNFKTPAHTPHTGYALIF